MLLTEDEINQYAEISRRIVPDDRFLELLPQVAEEVRQDPALLKLRDPFSLLAVMAIEILKRGWTGEVGPQPPHVVTATIHRIMEEWVIPEWWPWTQAQTEASLAFDFGAYAAEMQYQVEHSAPGERTSADVERDRPTV